MFERLRRAPQWLRKRYAPGGLILLYHCVSESLSDPFALNVTPQHFAEHLEVLRKHGRPLPLQQLIQMIRDGKRPHRSVVVTFDDGYANNLHEAKPLLERHDVPATIFIATGQVGSEREFWWDELTRLLLQPGTLPATLHLKINGSDYQWELHEAIVYGEEEYRRQRDWRVRSEHDPCLRHTLCRALYELLQPLPECARRKTMDELFVWADVKPLSRSSRRTLTPDEVNQLGKDKLIEIGGHTVNHPNLALLSATAQRNEIEGSKIYLENILGRPVTSFAYPFGGTSDYTAETVAAVRNAGFDCACSNFQGTVWGHTDRFQLPRLYVENWDGDEFGKIVRWLTLG